MSEEEYRQYMRDQHQAIERAKWDEGCKIHRDPGAEFILRWINLHGEQFRQQWIREKRCNF